MFKEGKLGTHSRFAIDKQRIYSRKSYYKILKAIKGANERDEKISLAKIRLLLSDLGTEFLGTNQLNKFIRDAESWGMIEGHFETGKGGGGPRLLTVTKVGDAFIEYCEQTENTRKSFKEMTVMERYQNRSGDFSMTKFFKIANEARGHRITFRNAAQTLGLSLKEFKTLLEELSK